MSAVTDGLRFLLALPRFLNNPISCDGALEIIRARMERRSDNFLELARRAVFENPGSPYLPLFKEAGCGYSDVESGVKKSGLEGFLKKIKSAGVYVSYDEFKGRKPIRRGRVELKVTDRDFDNVVSGGIGTLTGGSSGAATSSKFNLDFLAGRATYDAVMFQMLGVFNAPLAIWYPGLPAATGMGNCLRYAKIGSSPMKWFRMPTSSSEFRAIERAIVLLSKFTRAPLPFPEPLGLDEPGRVVQWIIKARRQSQRVVVQTYPSQATRICRAAHEMNVSLDSVLFIVGSESLTATKRRAIEDAGATVYQRCQATEIGSIAQGCASHDDDLHLLADTIAMVQDDDSVLHLTSFMSSAPKVMINVSLGDTAVVNQDACDCPLGQLGFNVRLRDIRSIERVTGGGMAVSRRILSCIAEEDLPQRFGGGPVDYQWKVEEDGKADGKAVCLRVSPAVGRIDEAALREFVLSRLERVDAAHRFYADMWRQSGAIMILREEPRTTPSGKVPPVM